MMRSPRISAKRAAQVFKEAVSCRRLFCDDNHFFKMPDLWDHLCEGNKLWSIKLTTRGPMADYQRRAGVIAVGDFATLIIDQELMRLARTGRGFANFILAHEMAHLMLDHHDQAKVVKNFKVVDGESGKSVLPPSDEELEANYAAVFLQCGVALLGDQHSAIELAKRANTDVSMVKKAQRLAKLPDFRRELAKVSRRRPRVVL